jgi:hypothetical protein
LENRNYFLGGLLLVYVYFLYCKNQGARMNKETLSTLFLLLTLIAFISGIVIGGLLTAYEVRKSIEAMGNIFGKIEIGNITIDLNETEITQTAIKYAEQRKMLERVK